ncbi:MAG: hypothetical protein JOZ52_13180 [Acidobacteria bacterium]|nr:hypothetical protein [Acidobacteriota bacterium]
MAKFKDPLSRVKVAAPCSADWESMIGDARRRFCSQCELNVYNLSEMTKREAEEFLNQSEGRLCVRFYRRADGTILTQDCPVGLRAMRRRLKRIRTAIVSTVLSFLAGTGIYVVSYQRAEVATTGMLEVPLATPPSQEHQEIPKYPHAMGEMAPIYRQHVTKPKKRNERRPS